MEANVYKILQEWHELFKSGVITEEEFNLKKKELLEEKQGVSESQQTNPEVNNDSTVIHNQEPISNPQSESAYTPNPEYENSEPPKDSGERIKKNRTLLIIFPLIIIILVVAYLLFLKPDPVKDGKKAAEAFCNCTVQYNKAVIAAGNNFLNSFTSANYSTRQAALSQWQEIQYPINTEYSNCKNAAQTNETDLNNKYSPNENQNEKFEDAFNDQLGLCNSQNQSEVTALFSDIQSKIASIVVPIPTLNQITNDLASINFQIWPYQGSEPLTSSNQWDIQTENQTDNSIDFIIDMSFPYPSSDIYHPANTGYPVQIQVNYIMGNQGWQFSSAKTLKIILDYTVPTGRWINVPSVTNFYCSFNSRGNKYWVQDQYGQIYKGGPDVPSVNLKSNTMLFASREDTAFDMFFTYTPTN